MLYATVYRNNNGFRFDDAEWEERVLVALAILDRHAGPVLLQGPATRDLGDGQVLELEWFACDRFVHEVDLRALRREVDEFRSEFAANLYVTGLLEQLVDEDGSEEYDGGLEASGRRE